MNERREIASGTSNLGVVLVLFVLLVLVVCTFVKPYDIRSGSSMNTSSSLVVASGFLPGFSIRNNSSYILVQEALEGAWYPGYVPPFTILQNTAASRIALETNTIRGSVTRAYVRYAALDQIGSGVFGQFSCVITKTDYGRYGILDINVSGTEAIIASTAGIRMEVFNRF